MPKSNGLTEYLTNLVLEKIENGDYYPKFTALKRGMPKKLKQQWPVNWENEIELWHRVRDNVEKHSQWCCLISNLFYRNYKRNNGLPASFVDAKKYLGVGKIGSKRNSTSTGLYISNPSLYPDPTNDCFMLAYLAHHKAWSEMATYGFNMDALTGVFDGRLDKEETEQKMIATLSEGLTKKQLESNKLLFNRVESMEEAVKETMKKDMKKCMEELLKRSEETRQEEMARRDSEFIRTMHLMIEDKNKDDGDNKPMTNGRIKGLLNNDIP